MIGESFLLINLIPKLLGTVRYPNDQFASKKIIDDEWWITLLFKNMKIIQT